MKAQPASHTAPVALKGAIFFLSTILTFLWIWLLGFVLHDIGDLRGPDFEPIKARHIDPTLEERGETLQAEIKSLEVQIRRQQEIQSNLRNSMDNARATMEQMMSLHRLSIEREVTPGESQQEALTTSQQRFIDAQDRYEQANAEITNSNQRKFDLAQELESVNQRLEEQRKPANEEYGQLRKAHRFKVASLKLAFIVPFFLAAGFLVFKKRESIFRPILMSLLMASFWKVGVVMFEHFPREFFKYIAIAASIFIVLSFLIWMLKRAARPGIDLLIKRYREAYQRHRCPVCDYPIMRGPLKNALWTRRKLKFPDGAALSLSTATEEAYACPACGSQLFEACSTCEKQRHSLLPFCEHCGDERITEVAETSSQG